MAGKKAKMGHHKKGGGGSAETPIGSYPTGRTVKPSYGQLSGALRGFSVFDAAGEEIAVGLGMWDAIWLAKTGGDPSTLISKDPEWPTCEKHMVTHHVSYRCGMCRMEEDADGH